LQNDQSSFRSFEIPAAVGEEHQEQQAEDEKRGGKLMPDESVHQFDFLAERGRFEVQL
jgi:hypothetical protein